MVAGRYDTVEVPGYPKSGNNKAGAIQEVESRNKWVDILDPAKRGTSCWSIIQRGETCGCDYFLALAAE
jgi:hypothetical protein